MGELLFGKCLDGVPAADDDRVQVDPGGQVAMVTAGAGAIGRDIAGRRGDYGAKVVIADIKLDGAREMTAQLPDAMVREADISNDGSVMAGVAARAGGFGRIDILVNNAGINSLVHRVNIDEYPVEEGDRIARNDRDGLFLMRRSVLRPMVAQGEGGRIINIASVVGLAAMRLQGPLVAAKAGIIHLTRSTALEPGPKGILTDAIAPGSVMSAGTRELLYGSDGEVAARTAEFLRHVPLGAASRRQSSPRLRPYAGPDLVRSIQPCRCQGSDDIRASRR